MNPDLNVVYVPVVGATVDFDEYPTDFPGERPIFIFRRLDWGKSPLDPPSRIAKFMKDEYTLTYAQFLGPSHFEIEYRTSWASESNLLAPYFSHFLSVLMLRAHCNLAASIYSTLSLQYLDTLPNKTLSLHVFNNEDTHYRRAEQGVITKSDVDWAVLHYHEFSRIIGDNAQLWIAYEAVRAERFAHVPTMSLLTLWSGLEAFFAIDREQSFRLSLMISYFLESEPAKRKELFEKTLKEYGMRSAVAHGRKHKRAEVEDSVNWTASILRRCLVKTIETKAFPTRDSLLFSLI
jgi:hypothetical protein